MTTQSHRFPSRASPCRRPRRSKDKDLISPFCVCFFFLSSFTYQMPDLLHVIGSDVLVLNHPVLGDGEKGCTFGLEHTQEGVIAVVKRKVDGSQEIVEGLQRDYIHHRKKAHVRQSKTQREDLMWTNPVGASHPQEGCHEQRGSCRHTPGTTAFAVAREATGTLREGGS